VRQRAEAPAARGDREAATGRHADLGAPGPADGAAGEGDRRPAGGRCCDVSEQWTSIARRYWKEAGLDHKIELAVAPALGTLDGLLAKGLAGRIDLAFIDANKNDYDAYYERCLTLLRPGGLILIDNVLWGGSVIDRDDRTADTKAIRALNAKLAKDERIDLTLFAVGDGMTAALKR
jgi:predicted O-methyltransferase YrrM